MAHVFIDKGLVFEILVPLLKLVTTHLNLWKGSNLGIPFRGGLCGLSWSYHDSRAKDLLRLWQAILDVCSIGGVWWSREGTWISLKKERKRIHVYTALCSTLFLCRYKITFEETPLGHEDVLECFVSSQIWKWGLLHFPDEGASPWCWDSLFPTYGLYRV